MSRFKQRVCEEEQIFWDEFWAELENDPELSLNDLIKLMEKHSHRLIGGSIEDRLWEMKTAFEDRKVIINEKN